MSLNISLIDSNYNISSMEITDTPHKVSRSLFDSFTDVNLFLLFNSLVTLALNH